MQLTNVLSNRAVNEVMRRATPSYLFGEANLTHWSNHWMAQGGPFGAITTGSPRITFTGFTIGGNTLRPRYRAQDLYSVRDNFTLSYDATRPPRPEDRRRVPPASALHATTARSAWAMIDARGGAAAGQHRGALSRRRSTPTRGTWRRSRRWCGATRWASSRAAASPIRIPGYARMVAGRLARDAAG